jgi:hypothetical protein
MEYFNFLYELVFVLVTVLGRGQLAVLSNNKIFFIEAAALLVVFTGGFVEHTSSQATNK